MQTLPGLKATSADVCPPQDRCRICSTCVCSVSLPSIRCPGSAAINMCLVACGSADAYYHMGIHCWDMAGGAAIVTEAGGVIMDVSGESRISYIHFVASKQQL